MPECMPETRADGALMRTINFPDQQLLNSLIYLPLKTFQFTSSSCVQHSCKALGT
jgi:hypothetical protein